MSMRYIATADGHLVMVSFGATISCDLGNCTEYTGDAPAGYDSLADWHAAEGCKLHRWQIVDGQLTLDLDAEDPVEIAPVAFVYEQGTDGIWSYRKWSDGSVELWGRSTKNVNTTQAFGNIYRSTTTYRETFPFTFKTAPICSCAISSAGDWALWEITHYSASTTQTKAVYVGRASSNTGISVTFDWYARGVLA